MGGLSASIDQSTKGAGHWSPACRQNSNLMAREYPEHPLVGVAAVVVRGDQVLLVQRGREPARGLWGLPGGMLELGETLAEGVRREVLEETGVHVEIGPLLAIFEPMLRDADGRLRFHYVVVDYLARYLGGEPRPADDADDARWVDVNALDGLAMQEETRAIIRRGVTMGESQRIDNSG